MEGTVEQFVIVGAGLTGMALAESLAVAGARVTLLERAVPGAEASSAAAGILAPRVEAHGRAPLRDSGVASLDSWEGWLRALGVDPAAVGFARCGVLVVRDACPDVDATLREDARSLEPALGSAAAWWLPEEGVVDPRRVLSALRSACLGRGVRVVTGVEVTSVAPGRVTLADGGVERGTVVVCAGAWTGMVPGAPRVPVRPVRGQLVALEGVAVRRVVFGAGGYVVPRPAESARVIVGATVEEAGFAKAVTAGGLHQVLATGMALAPALAGARVVEHWAGLRPGTPDELPLLGCVEGVWIVSGHYRNGVLLAPWTACTMRDALLEGAPVPSAFSVSR